MTAVDIVTGEIVADCTPDEARLLTDELLAAADAVEQSTMQFEFALLRCHDRGAWRALGFSSFQRYVADNLRMSRPRAYQLLNHARVVAELAQAAGVSTAVDGVAIPERAARELKPHLEVVKERVAEATADTPDEGKADAARAAIDEFRQELRENDGHPVEHPKAEAPITKPDLGGGVSHPARFSDALMPIFAELLGDDYEWVLDPFAGTGRIHELPMRTVGVELEPEWAELHADTIVGSALDLPWEDAEFDAICTSPTYGNRLADSHNASDPERRRSYTHDLGRELSDDNSGAMQWGPVYRTFHEDAWAEAVRVLRPGGRFVLNIKDHVRDGVHQPVAAWHVATLSALGLHYDAELSRGVPTGHLKQGANAAARAGQELVLVFEKGID